ncbi:MAG: P1 family peptidase [Thermodesulfobacteriota bacterium]
MEPKKRARDLGVPFEGVPGAFNAITDVAGVAVGHATIVSGHGPLVVGRGPIRTGVTAILPRRDELSARVFAAWFPLNGNGEMTGTAWVEESGCLEGPVMLTNTHSVGLVRDTVIEWQVRRGLLKHQPWSMPVVAETYDGYLNDINGQHVRKEHVFAALDGAASGPVAEGNVGGGTGMVCHEFKGGIGTSSRVLSKKEGGYTVGVLVQANHGRRFNLRIAGVPVAADLTDHLVWTRETGSIIILVATDAPLLPHQLKRLARRAALGLARTGSFAANFSGDLFLAFSTANAQAAEASGEATVKMVLADRMDFLFLAVVQATEEAVVNALVAAETMAGIDDRLVLALPQERLRADLKKHGLLTRRIQP